MQLCLFACLFVCVCVFVHVFMCVDSNQATFVWYSFLFCLKVSPWVWRFRVHYYYYFIVFCWIWRFRRWTFCVFLQAIFVSFLNRCPIFFKTWIGPLTMWLISSCPPSGETIGLSVGLFLGITFLTILVVAAACFFQKSVLAVLCSVWSAQWTFQPTMHGSPCHLFALLRVFHRTFKPWLRRVNEKKMDGKLYTGATVIHENLAVTESFLNGTTEAPNVRRW